MLHAIDLPDRGHDVTFDPVSEALGGLRPPARRPSPWSSTIPAADKPLTIASTAGRHFFGHGVFSVDGALLYATENDFDNAAGVIGDLRRARDEFSRIGEFADLRHGCRTSCLLLGDGRTLAIANGGIETPSGFRPRRSSTSRPMKPSYVLVDRVTGDLRREARTAAGAAPAVDPPHGHRSIRHRLVRLPVRGRAPSVRYWSAARRASKEIYSWLDMPQDVALRLPGNYIGSVAANPAAGTGRRVSPEGNSLAVIDAASGRIVIAQARWSKSAAWRPMEAASWRRRVRARSSKRGGATRSEPDYVWDNHMLRIEQVCIGAACQPKRSRLTNYALIPLPWQAMAGT